MSEPLLYGVAEAVRRLEEYVLRHPITAEGLHRIVADVVQAVRHEQPPF